ncbi:hypothetical protein GDO78_008246 [Eleutherodactylus coqui]|uniref:Uncharacterized protein n=1 Tax=Eleutherodactylus coqui TaxID=57060 RepID=A0A8J6FCX0_ELECQ|nr:hypothetical protein GDO78_008246 [Eleutherodactylus coqui]
MASWRYLQLLGRAVSRAAAYQQAVYLRPCVRAMSGGGIPTNEEQATGVEKKILDALKKGEDPFNMLAPKWYPGTKEEPNIVPSVPPYRLVACLCKCLPYFTPFHKVSCNLRQVSSTLQNTILGLLICVPCSPSLYKMLIIDIW